MALMWADLDQGNKYVDWPNAHVMASECGLYLCVKEFITNVSNGTTQETSTEIASTRAISSYQVIGAPPQTTLAIVNLMDKNLSTQRTDLEIQLPDGTTSPQGPFNISQAGVCGLIQAITKAFDDGTLWFVSPDPSTKQINRAEILNGVSGMVRLMPNGQNMQFTPDIMEVLWNNRGNDVLSTLFDNLAISLTNNIRKTSDQSKSFAGEEGIRTPIFQIDWKWLTPSAICVMMAWIFLFCAWWQSRKTNTPIWKGSLLAVLFHGLSVELKRSMSEKYLQSEMSKEADRITARLEEIDGGICLRKYYLKPTCNRLS
jgi:hypothetical protein